MEKKLIIIFTILFILCEQCICKNIFVINSYPENDDDELLAVAVLYRHGDRSPISSFPTDPYYDLSYWPQGFGQLLNKGKERQYNLGVWLRERYSTFLPEEYSPKDIRVVSSDSDRTLMSAAANLAGLYPPPKSEIWNKKLLWQPIPIHTTPQSNDAILAMDKSCPKYDQLYEDLIASDIFGSYYTQNSELFDYITNNTGRNETTLLNIANLYSVFYAYENYNASYIPEWASSLYKGDFTFLAGLGQLIKYFTKPMQRLKVGPLLDYLINYFDEIIEDVATRPKFLMLSGHDSNIVAILSGLDTYDFQPPEFASTLIFELFKNKKGIYTLNTLYKRNNDSLPIQLNPVNCGYGCDYDEFKILLEPIIINSTQWEIECEPTGSSNNLKVYWFVILLVVTFQINL